MRKTRNIVSIVAAILIVIILFEINYDDLSWAENKSNFLVIISMSLLLISMILSNRAVKKNK